jgi:hypothetical protein
LEAYAQLSINGRPSLVGVKFYPKTQTGSSAFVGMMRSVEDIAIRKISAIDFKDFHMFQIPSSIDQTYFHCGWFEPTPVEIAVFCLHPFMYH